MKKTLLSIIANLLLLPFLAAQASFYANDVNEPYADTAIVRSWDNGKAAITYYEIGLKKYIQYVDYQTGNSYRASAPDSVQILDMYIYKDIVYYCGYSVYELGGRGVVGYFKPVDFISSPHVDYHILLVPPLTHVKKLVVQENQDIGGVEVVAIGERKWFDTVFNAWGHPVQIISNLQQYFIFCRDILQPSVIYDIAIIPNTEYYYNVLLTDNHVAFVGLTHVPYNTISIRLRNRFNTALPGSIDDQITFPASASETFSAMHSIHLNSDTIATAYMYIESSSGIVSNRVRVIDIASLLMTHSQEYIVPDKSEVKDMVYMPADHSVVCMQDFMTTLSSYNSNFVYLNPFAIANYYTDLEYLKDVLFNSMTRGLGIKRFLASDGPSWFMKDKLAVGGYLNPLCPMTEEMECIVLKNLENRKFYNSLSRGIITSDIIREAKFIETRTVSIICEN